MKKQDDRHHKELITFATVENGYIYWIWKREHNNISYSENWERLLGYRENEISNSPEEWIKHVADEDLKHIHEGISSLLLEDEFSLSYKVKHSQGSHIDILTRIKVISRDEQGKPLCILGTHEDITEVTKIKKELATNQENFELVYAKLENCAFYDSLTGLPNRINIETKLNMIISDAISNSTKGAVLFIDLDNFKNLNDTLGHSFGDEVITKVGEVIKHICHGDVSSARVGGDEFVVVIPKFTHITEVIDFTKKILKSLEEIRTINNNDINLSTSIGISIFPEQGESSTHLLKYADIAMHKVKESGKNNFKFYTDEMTKEIENKMEIQKHLIKAIEKNELVLHYQPLIDANTESVDSVEALIRWYHPTKGMISPLVFIPIAEEFGIIRDLGTWVLNTACMQNKEWSDKGFAPIKVSINVSPLQLEQGDFVVVVKNALSKSGLDPKYLQLEITENVSMKFIDENIKILEELRTLGVNIAMDDFGTGYSSLNYLMKLPIDSLKIDKSFIDNINESSNKELIMDTIIKLAHNLNLEVIAEGVETSDQLNILKKMSCNKIQGYFYSKPLPKNDLEEFLNKKIVNL
ncbi:diguanylate cyclase (GGDEF)-like protein/PAS domain S-box-containing protein [Clostridium punense]|uniref:Diguanylate cyclase (GGDEF)-like protein/PAS domain S-box-containing protein n=1 Tax=Clostridium punense TaxID=1054297 RepID=A0ABS4JZT4_9CLOT|nr:GGDEF domain-containing phosphodiesterase [Clostridium punense]MBP2021044.1 diguanylate cyclase (GGDEF)-like protein/PAS domain S-box-containing protein [Clostridium punense]